MEKKKKNNGLIRGGLFVKVLEIELIQIDLFEKGALGLL